MIIGDTVHTAFYLSLFLSVLMSLIKLYCVVTQLCCLLQLYLCCFCICNFRLSNCQMCFWIWGFTQTAVFFLSFFLSTVDVTCAVKMVKIFSSLACVLSINMQCVELFQPPNETFSFSFLTEDQIHISSFVSFRSGRCEAVRNSFIWYCFSHFVIVASISYPALAEHDCNNNYVFTCFYLSYDTWRK